MKNVKTKIENFGFILNLNYKIIQQIIIFKCKCKRGFPLPDEQSEFHLHNRNGVAAPFHFIFKVYSTLHYFINAIFFVS